MPTIMAGNRRAKTGELAIHSLLAHAEDHATFDCVLSSLCFLRDSKWPPQDDWNGIPTRYSWQAAAIYNDKAAHCQEELDENIAHFAG